MRNKEVLARVLRRTMKFVSSPEATALFGLGIAAAQLISAIDNFVSQKKKIGFRK